MHVHCARNILKNFYLYKFSCTTMQANDLPLCTIRLLTVERGVYDPHAADVRRIVLPFSSVQLNLLLTLLRCDIPVVYKLQCRNKCEQQLFLHYYLHFSMSPKGGRNIGFIGSICASSWEDTRSCFGVLTVTL
jgi:hypothetical protein